jgi:hypothetical protein
MLTVSHGKVQPVDDDAFDQTDRRLQTAILSSRTSAFAAFRAVQNRADGQVRNAIPCWGVHRFAGRAGRLLTVGAVSGSRTMLLRL